MKDGDREVSCPRCQIAEHGTLYTFTVLLIWVVLTICLSIAPEAVLYALPTFTLELGVWAYRTVLLITMVFAFSESITAPSHWNAVNLTRETGKLLRGTRWGFFKEKKNECNKLKVHVHKQHIFIGRDQGIRLTNTSSQYWKNNLSSICQSAGSCD